MAWASLLGEPEVRLGQDLTVAPGADGGVRGRGVEADDEQEARPSGAARRARPARHYFTRKTVVPTFLPLTNQVTWCLPTLVEVILLT